MEHFTNAKNYTITQSLTSFRLKTQLHQALYTKKQSHKQEERYLSNTFKNRTMFKGINSNQNCVYSYYIKFQI